MEPICIEVKEKEDRLQVAKILIANGYTVRVKTETRQNSKAKVTVIEAWK